VISVLVFLLIYRFGRVLVAIPQSGEVVFTNKIDEGCCGGAKALDCFASLAMTGKWLRRFIRLHPSLHGETGTSE